MQLLTIRSRSVLVLPVLGLLTVFSATPTNAQSALDGAWKAVATVDADGNTTEYAEPGLFLFQSGYYSRLTISGDEKRPGYGEGLSRASADLETLRAVILPVTANAGAFEVDGNTVTMRPKVMIYPNRPDDLALTMEFEIDGDNAMLRSPNGGGVKLVRLK